MHPYVLPRINLMRFNLLSPETPFETTFLPVKTTMFRNARLFCCPFCGGLEISNSHVYGNLTVRINKGELKAMGYCCNNCHTYYYIPNTLTFKGVTYSHTTLQLWLETFERRENND